MKLQKEYIESIKNIPNLDIEKLEKCFDEPAKLGIRININKWQENEICSENIQKFMKKHGFLGDFEQISWCSNGFYIDTDMKLGKSILHELGLFYIQEPSAMSPVEFLNVKPSDVVLDLCASPGGKSTQISNKLTDGFLIANEIVSKRAKILAENIERLGLENVIVTNHSPAELEKKFEEYFDKILVDAPCSGEGMFRKNLDAMQEWNTNSPKYCSERQKEIVKSAYKMLKPDGIMVYPTCTFSLEENEEIVKFVLDNFADMELLPTDNKKFNFDNGNDIDGTKRFLGTSRLYPYKIKGEGHFFAVLHKKIKSDFVAKISKNANKNNKIEQKLKIFKQFLENHSKKQFKNFVLIGDFLYGNCKINIDELKVETAGILLGEFKKDIFIPSLHLARSLEKDEFWPTVDFDKNETLNYIQGLEINKNAPDGWVLLTYENMPICFGKCVNGKIKNHYPKALRKSNLI